MENGLAFTLDFLAEYYHHLMGLQHLTDKRHISDPVETMRLFYVALKRGTVKERDILSSVKYHRIAERVESFHALVDIMSAGKGKDHCGL